MDAYRDQYATIFNNGNGLTLLAISTDADTTQASWARDKDYPFRFMSDVDGAVGRLYGATIAGRNMNSRAVYVLDAEGKVAHVIAPFREIDAAAYEELAAAVRKVQGR